MSDDNLIINPDTYPIATIDGIFVNFVGDYASIIMYQNRILPPEPENDGKPDLKREIILDARMSIPTVEDIMTNLTDGIKEQRLMKLVDKRNSIWLNTTFADQEITSPTVERRIDEIKEENVLDGYFFDTLLGLDKEGTDKFFELIRKFVSDNLEEIRNLRTNYYSKERKEKNVSRHK